MGGFQYFSEGGIVYLTPLKPLTKTVVSSLSFTGLEVIAACLPNHWEPSAAEVEFFVIHPLPGSCHPPFSFHHIFFMSFFWLKIGAPIMSPRIIPSGGEFLVPSLVGRVFFGDDLIILWSELWKAPPPRAFLPEHGSCQQLPRGERLLTFPLQSDEHEESFSS